MPGIWRFVGFATHAPLSRETLTRNPGTVLAALFTKGGPEEAPTEMVPIQDAQSTPKQEEAYIISDRSGVPPLSRYRWAQGMEWTTGNVASA